MLVTGIQNVTRKDGTPAVIIHGLSRRSGVNGAVSTSIWSNPAEIQAIPVQIGDQIRGFREGGYTVVEKCDHTFTDQIIENIKLIL